jgi:hypothetical protein
MPPIFGLVNPGRVRSTGMASSQLWAPDRPSRNSTGLSDLMRPSKSWRSFLPFREDLRIPDHIPQGLCREPRVWVCFLTQILSRSNNLFCRTSLQ